MLLYEERSRSSGKFLPFPPPCPLLLEITILQAQRQGQLYCPLQEEQAGASMWRADKATTHTYDAGIPHACHFL